MVAAIHTSNRVGLRISRTGRLAPGGRHQRDRKERAGGQVDLAGRLDDDGYPANSQCHPSGLPPVGSAHGGWNQPNSIALSSIHW